MAGDKPKQPHMKFSALNVYFSGLGPNLIRLTRPGTRVSNTDNPLKSGDFWAIHLSQRENACK